MPLKDLPLEQINLTSGPDKINLQLDAVLQLDVPKDIAQSSNGQILLSLTSGKLWTTRSSSCSLYFHVDLEDDELDPKGWNHIVESLGHRLRDARLWPQLFLSTSLDIPQRGDSTKKSFSVRLGRKPPPLSSESHPGDWLAGNIDVQPPDGVRRAAVQGLQIRLKVQSVKLRRPPKQLKPADIAGDSMLLSLERFEGIVTNLSETLPLAVTNSFGFFRSEDPHFDSILLNEPLWNQSFKEDFGASEDMLFAPYKPVITEDDMLLSQSAASQLLSQSSTISSVSFQSSASKSLKRSKPPSSPVITAGSVQRLVEVGVHTLLEGPQLRRPKGFQNIVAEPPKSTCSLAKICPGIFNLGFREEMASNNEFLTTIARTVSSWPRNVQSPTLRKKLAQFENKGEKEINLTSLSTVVSGRLWAMMQRKLIFSSFSRKLVWEVLEDQKDVVREGDNRENLSANPTLLNDEKDGFENLLADSLDVLDGFDEKEHDEDILEFEGLLGDDTDSDNGLLDCLAEKEREQRGIEEDTDEMLFGFLGNEDEEEFAEDGEGDGSMMLLENREDGEAKCMLI